MLLRHFQCCSRSYGRVGQYDPAVLFPFCAHILFTTRKTSFSLLSSFPSHTQG